MDSALQQYVFLAFTEIHSSFHFLPVNLLFRTSCTPPPPVLREQIGEQAAEESHLGDLRATPGGRGVGRWCGWVFQEPRGCSWACLMHSTPRPPHYPAFQSRCTPLTGPNPLPLPPALSFSLSLSHTFLYSVCTVECVFVCVYLQVIQNETAVLSRPAIRPPKSLFFPHSSLYMLKLWLEIRGSSCYNYAYFRITHFHFHSFSTEMHFYVKSALKRHSL